MMNEEEKEKVKKEAFFLIMTLRHILNHGVIDENADNNRKE